MSGAPMVAVSWVVFTKVVVSGSAKPFEEGSTNQTTALLRKPVPFTVMVKVGSPELALVGEIEVSVGAGVKPPL